MAVTSSAGSDGVPQSACPNHRFVITQLHAASELACQPPLSLVLLSPSSACSDVTPLPISTHPQTSQQLHHLTIQCSGQPLQLQTHGVESSNTQQKITSARRVQLGVRDSHTITRHSDCGSRNVPSACKFNKVHWLRTAGARSSPRPTAACSTTTATKYTQQSTSTGTARSEGCGDSHATHQPCHARRVGTGRFHLPHALL